MGDSLMAASLQSGTVHPPLQQCAGAYRLVSDIPAGEEVISLYWIDRNWHEHQTNHNLRQTQSTFSYVIPTSCLCFLFVCFFVATRWRVEMWCEAVHLFLSSEASMAYVDNNKRRMKRLTYHDGISYTVLMLLYDNTLVYVVCVYKHSQSNFSPGRWVSHSSFLLTVYYL